MNLLSTFQQQFNTVLPVYFDRKMEAAAKLHPRAVDLLQMMREFIANGGKRFRPALFYYAYESTEKKGGIDPLHASLVFELFHTFALIHDDIIDNAPLRRGKPTVVNRYGVSAAILAGDLALNLTDEIFLEVLFKSNLDIKLKDKLRVLYDIYKQELIAGEYLDCIRIPETAVIMRLKTSLYSFVRPSVMGFLFGGGRQAEWEPILERLGTLFQLKDDYEGMFGDESTIGKSVTSDTEEGKNTEIIKLFLAQATAKERAKFTSFFGKGQVKAVDVQWLRDCLHEKHIDGQIRGTILTEARSISGSIGEIKKTTPFCQLVTELVSLISNVT